MTIASITATVVIALVAGGCASGQDTASEQLTGVDRTVTIAMQDTRFEPDEMTVRAGETIGFRFVNKGKVAHDAFVGDRDAQNEHEEEMRMTEDEHGAHSTEGSGGITVDAGGTRTLKHRFAEKGKLEIGCHQAGHYKAGMIVKVTVR